MYFSNFPNVSLPFELDIGKKDDNCIAMRIKKKAQKRTPTTKQ